MFNLSDFVCCAISKYIDLRVLYRFHYLNLVGFLMDA